MLRYALALAVASFVALLTYALGNAVDHRAESEYGRSLRTLKAADPALNEEVLRARSGLVAHYDGLVQRVGELKRLRRTLEAVPSFMGTRSTDAIREAVRAADAAVRGKDELIEEFKKHNAILHNSLHFLPVVVARASARAAGDQAVAAAQSLVSTVLLLDIAPDREAYARLSRDIDVLEALKRPIADATLGRDLAVTLQHARLIAKHKPVVDSLVARILEAPVGAAAARLESAYFSGYRDALDDEAIRQRSLFGLAFLIVILGLTDVIVRVKRTNAALAKTTLELTKANEALAREREKERELGELKTRFVSMTSHEFRTPLSAILSSSELLATYGAGWDRERTLSHLERIRTSALGMSEMLDDVLLIGRADAGALRSRAEPVDLEATCRRLIGTLEQTFGGSHPIRLIFSGDARVSLDERLMTHVLSNLLENAVKYSPRGSEVVLEIQAHEGECRFVVRDAGIGIPEADLPRLFQSFERGRNVGDVKGTGLGLAIVRRVLDAQGGTIDVKSVVGRGSEFAVTLPRARAPSQ